MVTIRQVARACGVSPMTVSFVLNNKPGAVSQETRERVLQAVRELGYRPRTPAARASRPYALGLVAGVNGQSLMTPGYFNDVLNGVLVATDELRVNVTLFTGEAFHADSYRSIRVLCDGRCDGLLVVAPQIGCKIVSALGRRGFPFAVLGDTCEACDATCVDADNTGGARSAVEFLLELGHHRIGYVGGLPFVRSVAQRREGYHHALRAAGIDVPAAFDIPSTATPEQVRGKTIELLSFPPSRRPTALFCWNDGTALTVMAAAREVGVRIPQELSVIGFDDDSRAAISDPPLTTVRQPFRRLAKSAVEAMLAESLGTVVERRPVLLETELMVRRSVASPPSCGSPAGSPAGDRGPVLPERRAQ